MEVTREPGSQRRPGSGGRTRRSGLQEAPGHSLSKERVHTDVYDVL